MKPDTGPEYRRMLARLRQAREEAGLTQAEVGRRLGVRQTLVSKMELGERRIDPIELVRFAEVYGRGVEFFVRGE
jgi:transcriptional regulator with XRE-family HTH domain